jgi:NADH:ubiquinone oxidoreductase subunit K
VTIGGSAALIIIGAILRFAVTWSPKNVDLQVIGVILMIGGAAGLCVAIGLMLMRRRDRQNRAAADVAEPRRYVEPPM